MGNDEILTDDYVAGLLSQEANDCSLKYSAMGMDAFRADKKPANMLKPNTRFLRHIIKDTDTHNKALLAKEAAESRARLKDLERTEDIKRRKTNPNSRDIRKRQMGDIHAILGGKKHRPTGDDEATSSSSRDPKRREFSRKSDKDKDLFNDRREEHRHRGRLSRSEGRHSKSDGRSHPEERRKRSRSRDSGSGEEDRSRHNRRRRDRSRSPERRRRSRSPRERKDRHRRRSPLHDTKDKAKQVAREPEGTDSDLDDLIGPAPPPRYRGRGTVGGSSGIDRRFSETYDPKTDVQMDDDDQGGNWDDAAEAFRDRQKLKQNQVQRLKAAGFADDQIKQATSTDAKSLADSMQWTKAGEKREWDRGKVVNAEGVVVSEDEL